MANRKTRVTFPVFNGYEVRVICAADIRATGRRLGSDLSGADAGFIEHDHTPGTGWLVLGDNPTPGVIAHEATHAVRALFTFAGVKATDEEAFAYHLEYLVSRIHKFMGRTKGPR